MYGRNTDTLDRGSLLTLAWPSFAVRAFSRRPASPDPTQALLEQCRKDLREFQRLMSRSDDLEEFGEVRRGRSAAPPKRADLRQIAPMRSGGREHEST